MSHKVTIRSPYGQMRSHVIIRPHEVTLQGPVVPLVVWVEAAGDQVRAVLLTGGVAAAGGERLDKEEQCSDAFDIL